MKTLTAFLIAFLITFIAMPFFRLMAVRLKILDLPGHRKMHKRATPLLGGLAIYLGFIVTLGVFYRSSIPLLYPFLIASAAIIILGLGDDVKRLSASFRLLFQALIALTVIFSGIRVSFLPPTWWGNLVEIILSMIWILGVTNAYNYLDGLDGLASGSAVINLFCFALILYTTSQYYLVLMAFVLMGAISAFLPFNFRKAKIFLGETGSTFLGFTLACLALMGHWAVDNLVMLFIPILVLGVPIFDMIFTTIMRVREAKVKTLLQWLQYGGKDHFHHYLVDIGLTPVGAVQFIYAITFSLGISALMVSNDLACEAMLTLAQAGIIFVIIAVLIVLGKKRRSRERI